MQKIYDTISELKRVVFALGVFDGVHLGHQAVIAELLAVATKYDAEPVVMYFDPFPANVLRGANTVPALTTLEQKEMAIAELGVRHIIRCPFTLDLAAVTPDDFVRGYFTDQPFEVKAICVGENWRFGKGNSGNAETLKELAGQYGIEVCAVPAKTWQDARISSTRIRHSIADGNFVEANVMMGRNFAVSGAVAHGNKIASGILHFPTINLADATQVIPKFGVYAAKVKFDDSVDVYPAIAYVGDAPTFRTDGKILFELHILNFSGDVYGQHFTAEFIDFIRPSMKFDSPAALSAQIAADIEKAKECLGAF